jgi:hypothetical protein
MREKPTDPAIEQLVESLLERDAAIARLISSNAEHRKRINEWCHPAMTRLRAERDLLLRKLDVLVQAERRSLDQVEEIARLRTENEEACREISRLRQSRSWRITAPLRVVYGGLLWLRHIAGWRAQ